MFLVSINAPILSKDTYLCSVLYIVAAFLEMSKSASFGFHLKHGTSSSGYNSFIASKLDSVPFNFRDALASVLFLLTIYTKQSLLTSIAMWQKEDYFYHLNEVPKPRRDSLIKRSYFNCRP